MKCVLSIVFLFLFYFIYLFIFFCIYSSVVHSDEFRALPADEVAQLIGSDHLTVPSEEEVSPSFEKVYFLNKVSNLSLRNQIMHLKVKLVFEF